MLKDKIIKYIETNLSEISPETVRIYTEKFSKMSDKDIKEYFKHSKLRLYVDDKKVNNEAVNKLVKKLNIVTQEKIKMPYKANAVSRSTVMIFPVQIRRLQQLATKQSRSEFATTIRNKGNQASSTSKTGKITDPEVSQLAALGLDKTLTELMSPRSDNSAGKKKMNELIYDNLEFSLSEIEISKDNKSTLKYIDALYKCMGLATDFIDAIEEIS